MNSNNNTFRKAQNEESSLSWMSFLDKYWESDLCLTKIKVNEQMKEIAFDVKNNKLVIATADRTIYFADIPK
jgi:hypothetical protein